MSCTKGLHGRVFFVTWETPSVQDVREIVREVGAAHAAHGHKLVYVAIAPEDSALPEPHVRDAMTTGMNATLEHCDSMFLVMEGSGFKNSVMRSILTAIFLAGGKRERVSVHKSLDGLFASVGADLRKDLLVATAHARASGVVRPRAA